MISRYYRQVETVLSVAEKLREEEKDIFRLPLDDLLGQTEIVLTKGINVLRCIGDVQHYPWPNQTGSFVLHGWTIGADRAGAVEEIYVLKEGRIIGGGTAAPLLHQSWLKIVANIRGGMEGKLMEKIPELMWAIGRPKGGWLAVVKGNHLNIQKLRYIALMEDGLFCEMSPFNKSPTATGRR